MRLLVTPRGWRSAEQRGLDTRQFEVAAAGAPFEVNFQAVRARTIRGAVADAQGRPVPHARVLTYTLGDLNFGPGTTANDRGEFETTGPRPEATCVLNAYRGNDQTTASTVVAGNAEGRVNLRLFTGARPTLTGHVVSATGQPVPYAVVRVDLRSASEADPRGGWSCVSNATADAGGVFKLQSLWPLMPMALRLQAKGLGETEQQVNELGPGEVRDLGEIVMPIADLVVTGIVVDADERPVAQVPLDADRPGGTFSRRVSTVSGPDGCFRLEDLPREELRLSADPFRYDSFPVTIGPDNLTAVVRVIPRDRQVLYTYRFEPPLTSEAAGFKVSLVALHRYQGFDANHEPRCYLGLDLVPEGNLERWLEESVSVTDDQGRALRGTAATWRGEGNRGQGVELPLEGATKLSKITWDQKVLFENVPLTKELTAAPQ